MLVFILVCLLGCMVAGHYGPHREIGVGWAVFFCVFFSPLIGYFIIMTSPLKSEKTVPPAPTLWSWFITSVLLIIGIFFLINGVDALVRPNPHDEIKVLQDRDKSMIFPMLFLSIGFLGSAFYASRIFGNNGQQKKLSDKSITNEN